MVSVSDIRRRLISAMPGLYVLLNASAKKHYGYSFENLVVNEPKAARELLEHLLGPRARIVARILFGEDGDPFPGGGAFVGEPSLVHYSSQELRGPRGLSVAVP